MYTVILVASSSHFLISLKKKKINRRKTTKTTTTKKKKYINEFITFLGNKNNENVSSVWFYRSMREDTRICLVEFRN